MQKLLPSEIGEKGQSLLIVLLSMAVILTVVLSVISRSITDISLTTYSEDALRAFSAAEAGVERALIVGSDISEPVGEASFTAYVSGLAEGLASFDYPVEIYSGESIYIWFVSHDPTTGHLICGAQPCYKGPSAQFCWGKAGTSADAASPAVEISVFYDSGQAGVGSEDFANVRIARATFDPFAGRNPANSFAPATVGGCSSGSYAFSANVDFTDLGIPAACELNYGCLLAARVRTFYNNILSHPVGVNVTGGLLPAQGRQIDSTGTTSNSSSVRKIQASRTFGGPPPIFDAAVFSEGNVEKP